MAPSLSIEIEDCHGLPNLLETIRGRLEDPDADVLGIVADANDNPSGHWRDIRNRLLTRRVNVPESLGIDGVVIPSTDIHPRVGVWLMPNNVATGELENFVAEMIPHNDPVWPLAQDYVAGIPEADRKFAPRKEMRTRVHAWLATREDPRRMGMAILAGDLDVTVPLAVQFMDWLNRLFDESAG